MSDWVFLRRKMGNAKLLEPIHSWYVQKAIKWTRMAKKRGRKVGY
jgi:hypothetical protein